MSSRIVSIHQPECFPWLGFIDKAAASEVFVIFDDAQYVKNYFNNRNRVRTAQGSTWLTIPILTAGRATQTFKETLMSDDASWRRKHLSTWTQNYGATPHAKQYLPFLEDLYSRPIKNLCDFNVEVIRWLFKQFSVKAEIVFSSQMNCPGAASEKLLALCQKLGASTYLSGISGKEYLDESIFKKANIAVQYQDFHHPIYKQKFEPFMPAMSSLDLLFNYGPESAKILRDQNFPRIKEVFT